MVSPRFSQAGLPFFMECLYANVSQAKCLSSGSPSLGAKVPKWFSQVSSEWFSQAVPLRLVTRRLDSQLRSPRFSHGSLKVLPSGSPSHADTSAGFSAKVPKVLSWFSQAVLLLLVPLLPDSRLRFPRFSQGSPKRFSFSWWHVCRILG